MKNYLFTSLWLIAFLFAAGDVSVAQKMKIAYDDDTIKVNGTPYAVMKKISTAFLMHDWSVKSLSGTELIYLKTLTRIPRIKTASNNYGKTQEPYVEMNFIGSGAKAEFDSKSGNYFAKLIAESNLVKDNAIDPEAEKRFIQVNNGWYPSAPQNSSPTLNVVVNNNIGGQANDANATPVKSKSTITINGNQIMRDNTVIGKFRQDTSYLQRQITITIYNESGEKVADALAPLQNAKEWSIKLSADGKTINLMYDAPNEREKMFKYLSDKSLLIN